MKRISYILTLIFASVMVAISAYGSDFVQPMSGKMVSDYAGVFSNSQLNRLETTLRNFNDTTSTQIAVLTVNDLNGYAASEYAIRTAEEWGIGQKGKDNGILMLIKPKNATKGEIFIAVGYGLEGAIPDAITKRIIEYNIIPYFMKNDYYSGVQAGVSDLMKLSTGEYTADDIQRNGLFAEGFALILIVIVSIMMFFFRTKTSGTFTHGGYNTYPRGGGFIIFGGNNRGGSGQNGGFGGGFGGFGGGGFGGGGAGGSW
ncbi:MAG: TPM domain-containing protein [Rikenellaceae bacterium]